MQPCAASIEDASGVRPKAAPGGRDGQACCIKVREIVAGERGSSEPPRRLSGRKCRGYCGRLCGARRGKRRRWCPHWCGHRCAAECASRCTAQPAPARHEVRRALSVTVSWSAARPVRVSGKRSAQRPKGAEARGIAEEIGAKRRLERKARPRSGSPDLDLVMFAPVSIFSTGDCIGDFTHNIAVSFRVTRTGSTGGECVVVGMCFVTICGGSVGGDVTGESTRASVGGQTLPHSTASW